MKVITTLAIGTLALSGFFAAISPLQAKTSAGHFGGYGGYNQNGGASMSPLFISNVVNALAQRFNLQPADVQRVFDDQMRLVDQQRQDQLREDYIRFLDAAIDEGDLTEAQKSSILSKLQELNLGQPSSNTQQNSNQDPQYMQTQLNSLRQWGRDNDISSRYLWGLNRNFSDYGYGYNNFGYPYGNYPFAPQQTTTNPQSPTTQTPTTTTPSTWSSSNLWPSEQSLNQDLSSGRLTQAQRDAILARGPAFQNFWNGLSNQQTSSDRLTAVNSELASLRQWAVDNQIPSGYLPVMNQDINWNQLYGTSINGIWTWSAPYNNTAMTNP